MKFNQILAVACLGAAVASFVSARRMSGGAPVPPEAVALHGAAELYRALALFFGKQALRAEAHYWKAVGNG